MAAVIARGTSDDFIVESWHREGTRSGDSQRAADLTGGPQARPLQAPRTAPVSAGRRPVRAVVPVIDGAWGRMISIGRLIHLNGPPGVGKTSLARRYLEDHPLALVVDIDGLRTNLGQWATHEESRLLARDLAISLIDCHLGAGHDVVLPQFVGRLAFIERLEATASRHDAEFIEVLLNVDQLVAADRFRSRRREQQALSAQHPESDVDDHSVDEIIMDALVRLADIAAARPGAKTVSAVANLEQTYQVLLAMLDDRTS